MNTLLFSGGLDSACAFYVLGKPAALYCGGEGGPAREANLGELQAVAMMRKMSPEFLTRCRMILMDFSPFMRAKEWNFPREQLLCQLAWSHGSNKVFLGWTKSDGITQARAQEQCAKFAGAVDRANFTVEMPFWNVSKAQLVRMAIDAGAPHAFLLASHSCVRQSEYHCGDCMNCCERFIALKCAGVHEPITNYSAIPQKSGGMKELVSKFKGLEWFDVEAVEALGTSFYERLTHARSV